MTDIEIIVKNLVRDLEYLEIRIESTRDDLEKELEPLVTGTHSIRYKAAERLLNTASSAIEEARSWIEAIK